MIYLFPKLGGNPLAPVFEFDAVLREKRRDGYRWTEHPIENEGDVSDHASSKPKLYSATGIVTAWPLGLPADFDRLQRVHDALTKLADLKQIVTVVFGSWVADLGIENVEAERDVETGEALRITIEFKSVQLTSPSTVQIPASRLKSSVRRRAAPGKKGGAGTTKTPDKFDAKAAEKYGAGIDNSGHPYQYDFGEGESIGGFGLGGIGQ